ncbi:fungal-specific transcription factor domain-containing protein [Xylariaceae sp. FL1651]|nr:fungal-specific transcription factor domain-containing protein [Xylariaceae sp. FL1651]
MAGSSAKKAAGGVEIDILNQENVSQRASAPRRSSRQQVRHRASVACASCRDRRIRCVVPKGESECTQCQRSGAECVIKNDDERRRPISKAYMSSLLARVNLLEGMLLEKGIVAPPATHPPKMRHELSNSYTNSPTRDMPSPPDSHDEFAVHESPMEGLIGSNIFPTEAEPLYKEQSPFRMLSPTQEDTIYRLFTTKGNLSFDQISGRLRFFGPTTNSHVHAESSGKYDSREPPEQIRRAERIIKSLTPETHDALMQSFWEYHNSVLQVIDREAFEADRESQNTKFYSSFLHITILAVGWRFVNKDNDDMMRINLGNRESTLHRGAKHMLDIELERPGNIPSVQALLLLGDLECGVGRDNTGWMYAGMANRLAFDVGLHLDCSNKGLPDHEVRMRYRVMKACVLYDKYWALFLGRPTSIKSQDVGLDLLSKRFISTPGSLEFGFGATKPADTKATEEEIHEQLMELMELAGRIIEVRDNSKARSGHATDHANLFAINEAEDNTYMQVIGFDRQLQNWYRRLPEYLAWNPANIKISPFSYFLLHEQYHATMILLHHPWAKYGLMSNDGLSPASYPSPDNAANISEGLNYYPLSARGHASGLDDSSSLVDDSRTSLSRSICTQQAIRIAQVFWQSKQRYNLEKICCTGMQHAGTASIALIAAIAHNKNEADRRSYLGYLEVLADAIQSMSRPYQPAARMNDLIQAVLAQLRSDTGKPQHSRANSLNQGTTRNKDIGGSGWEDADLYSILPMRRENSDRDQSLRSNKRPRITPSRRASEFARPPPPFCMAPARASSPNSVHSQHLLEMHHQSSSMSAAPFDLESFRNSAIDIGSTDEQSEFSNRGSSDYYLLVAPSAEGWGLHSVHANSNRQQQPQQPSRDFDFQMSDWVAGSARLSATAALLEPMPESQDATVNQSVPALTTGLSSSLDSKWLLRGKGDGAGSMEWMSGEGGLHSLSPTSLSGLVEDSEKPDASAAPPRNHELDFFSF